MAKADVRRKDTHGLFFVLDGSLHLSIHLFADSNAFAFGGFTGHLRVEHVLIDLGGVIPWQESVAGNIFPHGLIHLLDENGLEFTT